MSRTFYIVDDDKSVRKILSNIIQEHGLGEVVGTAEDGISAGQEIISLRPAIVLIDLLLPGLDGITLVAELGVSCPGTCFVMVSQVTNKEMVSKAYTAGIDFFIQKPINVVEVVSVIRKVQDKMEMHSIIQSLRVAIGGVGQDSRATAAPQTQDDTRKRVNALLSRLGILGESGSGDIVDMCLLYLQHREKSPEHKLKLSSLHMALAQKYEMEHGAVVNMATIEQRIRRAISKALNNMASLGIEDYSNDFFVSFAGTFFDFAEVRRQMNYIRGTSETQGKINVRKFIEGVVAGIEHS